jgi:N-acetylmuramoyl-L-alanine amidase
LQAKAATSEENFKNPPSPSARNGKFWLRLIGSMLALVGFWACLWRLTHVLTPENPGFVVLPALQEGQILPDGPELDQLLPTIVVDAGHGGDDPGTQGNGMIEREGVLPIAKALAKELRARKHEVLMTRDGNTTLSLEQRSRIGNGPKRICFVSIHLNHSDSPRSAGIETYYGWPKRLEVMKELRTAHKVSAAQDFMDQRSRLLAEAVHRAVLATTQAPDREVRNNPKLLLLNSIRVPTILVECGFVSNKAETEKLREPAYQEQLAKGIANGIETYLEAAAADPNYGIEITTSKPGSAKK